MGSTRLASLASYPKNVRWSQRERAPPPTAVSLRRRGRSVDPQVLTLILALPAFAACCVFTWVSLRRLRSTFPEASDEAARRHARHRWVLQNSFALWLAFVWFVAMAELVSALSLTGHSSPIETAWVVIGVALVSYLSMWVYAWRFFPIR